MSAPNKPQQHKPDNPQTKTHNNSNQKSQHEHDPPVNHQQPQEQKQMRRVAQRSQMPTDKTQLIQYLSSRIKQAEDALLDTEDLLEEEVKQRQKIAKALDLRNEQLSKLYQVDQRGLPQKIKQKLTEILTTTVTQKIESQQKLNDEKLKNYQYKSRYQELKHQDKINKAKLEDQQKKQKQLQNDLENALAMNKVHEEELERLQAQYAKFRGQKEDLEDKYLQMRVAMERMGDVKGVLNRFFGNQDLFDEKMELKAQKVQRLPQPAKQSPSLPPPSREGKTGKPGNNANKLKPITKTKGDDEDFWKADFKGKNSVY